MKHDISSYRYFNSATCQPSKAHVSHSSNHPSSPHRGRPSQLLPSPSIQALIRCNASSHLCRAGRPFITPACRYWSTTPVCKCYFKTLRPVISMLMIVIAKLTGAVWLFQAAREQRGTGRTNTPIFFFFFSVWWADNLMKQRRQGQICKQERFLLHKTVDGWIWEKRWRNVCVCVCAAHQNKNREVVAEWLQASTDGSFTFLTTQVHTNKIKAEHFSNECTSPASLHGRIMSWDYIMSRNKEIKIITT